MTMRATHFRKPTKPHVESTRLPKLTPREMEVTMKRIDGGHPDLWIQVLDSPRRCA
jgi:hypothetical protein